MILVGKDGKDSLTGSKNDDFIFGARGKDTLKGGKGKDTIHDGSGRDSVFGDRGSDTFVAMMDRDKDSFDGGAGIDTLIDDFSFMGGTGRITFDIGAGTRFAANDKSNGDTISAIENWTFTGDQNVTAIGNKKKNVFITDDGNDVLRGKVGKDTLDSGNGADKLFGGAGNDTLIGGGGKDHLKGGTGEDTFVFHKGHGRDVIRDYSDAEDIIQIDASHYDIGDSIAEFLGKVGEIVGTRAVLTLDDGDKITIRDVSNLAILVDNIEFI